MKLSFGHFYQHGLEISDFEAMSFAIFGMICTELWIPGVCGGFFDQATELVEFEDGLRTGIFQKDGWFPCGDCTIMEASYGQAFKHGLGPGVVEGKNPYQNR